MTNRELDKEIAEKVLGWKLHGDDAIFSRTHGCNYVSPSGGYYGLSDFSTDMYFALQIVEELKDHFFVLQYDGKENQWTASFGTVLDHVTGVSYEPARAICLAAIQVPRNE